MSAQPIKFHLVYWHATDSPNTFSAGEEFLFLTFKRYSAIGFNDVCSNNEVPKKIIVSTL